MWNSTVGLVNGKHRYLTAETFGFKINSNGQQLKRRQQWTIEPFPEITGPDGSISSAASVSSQSAGGISSQVIVDTQEPSPCTILTPLVGNNGATPTTIKASSHDSNCSSAGADPDGYAGEEHENVALKSHLNKYLAVDSFGNVTCDSEEKTENARFTITICSMSQGRSKDEHIFWAFKNVERGYYLGTTDDGMICCSAKMPRSRAELWHLHLLPARGASFFALKSLGRKRFARLNGGALSSPCDDPHATDKIASQQQEEAQVQLDANLSWGSETLFQFKYHEGGRYSLLTASDNRLLTNEGKCITWTATGEADSPPPECLFTLEYHSGYLAFRDSFGQYLAAAGRSSVLRSRSVGVSRDELFAFEGVPVQVSFRATFNNRWVSIKQGVDLSANQSETTTRHETFQLTYHKLTHNWSIMTHDCNYWTIAGQTGSGANANSNNNNNSANQSTVSVCRPADYEGHTRGQFKLIWSDLDEPTVSLKYVDVARQERWIAARKSGQLYLAPPGGGVEPVKFIMRLQNRRLLNLRPVEGSGFVGLRSNGGGGGSAAKQQLESNKTTPDSIVIEYYQRTSLADPSAATPTLAPSSDGKTISTSASYNREAEKNQNSSNQVINVFNVKLNNTKLGQSVFDKIAATNQTANQNYQSPEATQNNNNIYESPKELECETIDANNNCMEDQNHPNSNQELESEAPPSGGGVESSSAPSVASIINSFSSNVKLSNSGRVSQQVSTSGGEQPTRGVAVSRLASSFEASRTTSSSASAAAVAPPQVEVESPIVQQQQSYTNECCYLKMHSSGNYLTIEGGPQGGAVLCDAASKLSAQAWRLELRSHNCIAIRASDTRAYMQLGTNGIIQMARCEPHEASLWEF